MKSIRNIEPEHADKLDRIAYLYFIVGPIMIAFVHFSGALDATGLKMFFIGVVILTTFVGFFTMKALAKKARAKGEGF